MSKVIIYTPAYNAEKTLRRAVDSILNQTHTDFVYYLLDNAATDSTNEIIQEYAKMDKRIIPLHNEVNWVGNSMLDVIQNYTTSDYFCALDADDEYKQDFLQKMLGFIDDNNLDMAVCGNDIISVRTGKVSGIRKFEHNMILEGNDFSQYFQTYYPFMRTVWGKVYSVSLLQKFNPANVFKGVSFGADTLFAMEAYRIASRVGILAESLHKYYVSLKSVSYRFDNRRIPSDRILFGSACDFLISKAGFVSRENRDYIYTVYFYAILDTLNVLTKAEMNVSDKLKYFLDILQNVQTQSMINKWAGLKSEKEQLFSQIATWTLSQKEVLNGQELEMAADIMVAVDKSPARIDGWKDEEVFLLLVKIRERQIKKSGASRVDSKINLLTSLSASPYLAEFTADFLSYFSNIIFQILMHDEINALNQIQELIVQGTDIPDDYIEGFLKLALNLSAKLEYPDYFIYYKKMYISLLIDLSKTDQAIEEFADWDKILPDDMEFKEFKKRLGI